MNKKELITSICKDLDVTQDNVKKVLNNLQKAILLSLKNDKEFSLFDLGKFKIYTTKTRPGFNPKTREKIIIQAKDAIKFSVSSKLKKNIVDKFVDNDLFSF